MHGTFDLSIQLGNEAMKDLQDVAEALVTASLRIRGGCDHSIIRDENGNTVGSFTFALDDDEGDEDDEGDYYQNGEDE